MDKTFFLLGLIVSFISSTSQSLFGGFIGSQISISDLLRLESRVEALVRDIQGLGPERDCEGYEDNPSYFSYADHPEEEDVEAMIELDPDNVKGQWTRVSLLITDIGPSDDLKYKVKAALTYGLDEFDPFYDYAVLFLKACDSFHIIPNPQLILSSPKLRYHLRKSNFNPDDSKLLDFRDFLDSIPLPLTSCLNLSSRSMDIWLLKRKVIIRLTCQHIHFIALNLDYEQFKANIHTNGAIAEGVLDQIIEGFEEKIIDFAINFQVESGNLVNEFLEVLESFLGETFEKLGLTDISLLLAIHNEISIIFSSALNMAVNYSGPDYSHISPDPKYPIL